ncbi:hypothetical protein GII33_16230 [Gordonia pseudamarae]|jgi:hypothetical protein|uniref:Uncharacterized protein n=1 Tax=Gordonia pseudamarae TaxID=2831662 RepID=A0ABX6IK97_9ACTN|nr:MULTISPECIES: hypothetical protein [Gordonia]MBD0024395.1 hypothetical protein [Gordonia sp. (in: high G+C Gram-positive bacteria)]QHN27269.1 hypothetical protein GII33_16230 [Gordonia pseudamarae]QHN36152.1 hypothetical protein GII31_16005 [Gordonia pseudamarae]
MSTARRDRGDVASITYADPQPKRRSPFRAPAPDERVAIRLHGHPRTYVVRVVTTGREPQLTELSVIADAGTTVDPAALREIPARRLAYSAAQWIARLGGQVAYASDQAETRTRPEDADPRVWDAARIADRALALGLPVRQTVADDLVVSTRTADRLLAKAKAEGFLDADDLPKRPQPRQKDTNR